MAMAAAVIVVVVVVKDKHCILFDNKNFSWFFFFVFCSLFFLTLQIQSWSVCDFCIRFLVEIFSLFSLVTECLIVWVPVN